MSFRRTILSYLTLPWNLLLWTRKTVVEPGKKASNTSTSPINYDDDPTEIYLA